VYAEAQPYLAEDVFLTGIDANQRPILNQHNLPW